MNSKSSLKNELLPITVQNIEKFIQQDPGNRGLSKWATSGTLFPACLSISGGDHIIITTGFYILNSGVIETDGPSGAIILAQALIKLGKTVTIISDDHAKDIIKTGLDSINCKAELKTFEMKTEIDYKSVVKENTTHFIALERPGKAADGFHHNFRGKIISDFVAPIDELFITCSKLGIITVAIGDGGNELGMGNTNNKDTYACKIKSNYCICAGVSNWAGYAISGVISLLTKDNVMPSFKDYRTLLESTVKAGAVDGVSGKQDVTVDGLDLSWEDLIYNTVETLVKDL